MCSNRQSSTKKSIISIKQIAPNQLEDVAEFFRTSKGLEEGQYKLMAGETMMHRRIIKKMYPQQKESI